MADEVEFGIALRCDAAGRAFELSGIVNANENLTATLSSASKSLKGYRKVRAGEHQVKCRVGDKVIQAKIRVFPPSEMGHCMGAGYVDISGFTVGTRQIYPKNTSNAFNWSCPGNVMLIKLSIRRTSTGTVIEKCTAADWDWDSGYVDVSCSKEHVR